MILPGHPWPARRANRSELGIIYVNPALVPWTPFAWCQVVSMNFGSGLYLVLSTLSRSTSWLPCRGRVGRKMSTEREESIGKPYSSFLSASLLHDRDHLVAPVSVSALLHCGSGLNPGSRQLTHQLDHVFSQQLWNHSWSLGDWVEGKLSSHLRNSLSFSCLFKIVAYVCTCSY